MFVYVYLGNKSQWPMFEEKGGVLPHKTNRPETAVSVSPLSDFFDGDSLSKSEQVFFFFLLSFTKIT